MLPPRTRLATLAAPGGFTWAAGIEDTVITQPWPGTGRTLDEYRLTGHDRRWAGDFRRLAALGVHATRYGVPWYRVQPTPQRWHWDWVERRIDTLLAHGIEPIIDLVHYGLPTWLPGAWLAADLPQRLAEFATRLFTRLRGRVRWYTPLNEPRITAWYCGRLGWWPPNRHGWRGFIAVLLSACRSICTTVAALRALDHRLVDLHVDATDVYTTSDPGLRDEAVFRRHLVFLASDLVTGRVDGRHPLRTWLEGHGTRDEELAWFQDHAVEDPSVMGLNLYPLFSGKRLVRTASGMRLRMPYARATIIDEIAAGYWQRYRRPLMISETASAGHHRRRLRWLEDSVAAVRRVRARGIPLVGYTWWPLFALVTWAYRQGSRPPGAYLSQMGLWDLTPELDRVHTPLVDAYAGLVRAGEAAVGPVSASASHRRGER
jgi:beta-glucosidase